MYTLCQIAYIFIFCDIAIVKVVYHLGNTTDIESNTRNSARHGLDNSIGEIVLQ